MVNLDNVMESTNIVDLIASMEMSNGLRSSSPADHHECFNFEAANEMIKSLGGSLVLVTPPPPDQEFQSSNNVFLYIMALMIANNKESKS